MSFVARLDIGRFDADGEVATLDVAAARRIAAEFADREPDGSFPTCRPEVLGYFDGEPLCLDRRGLLVAHVGYRDTARLFACLCRLVRQLGCEVWMGDCGECWSGRVCAER
jgi:hypothetical protein